MALASGTKLGPYEIQSPLGAGGMGEVYRARDTRLERIVAVKILPAQFSSDPLRKQRFEREAKTISNLNHPHICVLHDIGHQGGIDYLVMECVEGQTLAKRLEKGALALEQVLKYGAQIADALDKAHRSGVVHRDLKPGNVMLTPGGAKLLDFGLAKPVSPLSNVATLTATKQESPVTEHGTIVGTFQYMSPEQVEGKELDGRSDIFSLGAVLYEMLTGQRAFQGKSQLSVASAILEKEPVPISAVKPTTPPALDFAIRKSLAKSPDERWQSASDLASQLKWIAEAGSQAGASTPVSSHRKLREHLGWVVMAMVIVALVIVAVGWWRATRPVLRPLIRMSAELTPGPSVSTFRIGETILAKAAPGAFLALSPDGSRFAVPVRDTDGGARLAIRRLDEDKFKVLPGTENPTSPFFSPDGQWIAYFGYDGKLRKIRVQGGAPALLCDAGLFPSGSWGDDDTIIASLKLGQGLSRVPSEGGTPTPVTELAKGEVIHGWPQVLPGTRAVLFTAFANEDLGESGIDIFTFKTRERKRIVSGAVMGRYLALSNTNGYLLYLQQDTLFAVPFDIDKLAVTGTAQPILDDVTSIPPATDRPDYSFSRNGTFVYISGKGEPERSIFRLDQSGKTAPLHATPGFYQSIHFSPDGKRLAFVSVSRESLGQNDLWVQDLERNTLTRLTSSGVGSAIWSKDGKYILFSKQGVLHWVRSDGGGEPQQLGGAGLSGVLSSFSPDGRRIVIGRENPWPVGEVLTAPVEGTPDHPTLGKPELVLRTRFSPLPALSPDGRWLAYVSGETGTRQVYVQPFPGPGGKVPVSTDGGLFPLWSSNSRELFFCGLDHRIMVADYTVRGDSFSPGKPRVWSTRQILLGGGGGPFLPYAIAPDGKRFAVMLYPEGTTEQHGSRQLTFLLNFTDELRRRVPE